MINKKIVIKLVSIVPITILYMMFFITSSTVAHLPLNEMLLNEIFGQVSIGDEKAIVLVIENIYYIIIFNLLFGTAIYHLINEKGIYLFIRIKDRKRWFYKQTFNMLGCSALYSGFFLTTLTIIFMLKTNTGFNLLTIQTLFILWYFISMVLSMSTIAINLIAIRYGSNIGFLLVYLFMILQLYLSLKFDEIPIIGDNRYLLMLNPMAVITIGLSSYTFLNILAFINLIFLFGCLVWWGGQYVNKIDIGLSNSETR